MNEKTAVQGTVEQTIRLVNGELYDLCREENARLRKALEGLMDSLDGCHFGCGSCSKHTECRMGKSLCEANVAIGREPCHTKYPQQD